MKGCVHSCVLGGAGAKPMIFDWFVLLGYLSRQFHCVSVDQHFHHRLEQASVALSDMNTPYQTKNYSYQFFGGHLVQIVTPLYDAMFTWAPSAPIASIPDSP